MRSLRGHAVIASIRLRTPLIVALLALALSPATALAAPPPHDPYTGARDLSIFERDDPAFSTNVEATEAGEPQPCDVTMVATIWYRIPGTGGPVTLNTVGSAPDTVLAVYDTDGTDNGPPADVNKIACNNDIWDGGDAQDDRASELVFPTAAGSDYLVQIGSCSGCSSLPATGRIEFIAYDTPPNDARGAAKAITAGRGVLADNFGATTEASERLECGSEHPYGKTVWFRFNAAQSGTAVFTTGGGFDAVMAVYRGSTHLGCNDDGVPGAVGPSRLSLHLDPGDYLIQVGGWGGASARRTATSPSLPTSSPTRRRTATATASPTPPTAARTRTRGRATPTATAAWTRSRRPRSRACAPRSRSGGIRRTAPPGCSCWPPTRCPRERR